ncbi:MULTISPECIES: DUF2533 family protein [Aneurinibacillus]|uniref:YpbS family protein n=1 Tax=Aneurinibacillus thermoaerophilus TaxID=143495 RepID=A0A1G7Z807_ANETH|nr:MULTISPECIES: DUF2533 family protein [Aneurinibacillus]AMA72309.1 hypothetical protein ACH33_05205 [Aneurinibacillus sp. XH2]MED0674840.1 DUF2533 family protein [Aneurinibacillus thermoaerophilus]MED0679790.1 DUF2533 family protein [Aneurinibacillus thermoaerophilus]MED0735822.1 DUF2533 family protein [Aneurinibacillus thermoaerophilus]MED0758508.1 DUF2533 family protein [Aneurinibacillus thermoaerophilus]
MGVHHAISAHSARQAEYITLYRKLDAVREMWIEKAVEQCKNGEKISVEEINNITQQINQLAQRYHLPPRKLVTEEMVQNICK